MMDQLTPYAIEPYRKNMAITPTMQSIADEGIVFTNAYCNNPLCTPSRMSMMTGKYCSEINSFDNGSLLPADELCFTHLLKSSKYHTVLSGKMHFVGPDQEHGFSERLTTDVYPSGLDWSTNWKDGVQGDKINGLFESGVVKWNKYLSYDSNATFQAQEWLRSYSRIDKINEDPFFMCVSLINPHHPYQVPQEIWNMYDDRDIPLPEVDGNSVPTEDNSHEKWLRRSLELEKFNISEEEIIKARRAYFGCTTFADQKLAELMKTLEDLDLLEDTWIIITSDHGDMIGERGLWYKKIFYEYSAKVPLIIKPPKGCGGIKSELPVSLVDLFPTLMDITETENEFEVSGESLLPILKGKEIKERSVIMEYMGSSVLSPMRMVVKGNLKYVNIYTPQKTEELLFDLKEDPSELNNIISDSDYMDDLEELRKALVEDGWDGETLYEHILNDQKKRGLLRKSNQMNKETRWGFVPESVDPYDKDRYRQR